MFIMRLLATASVADDRITFTSGTSPQNNLGATRGPIRFEVVRRCEKWDKQNRTSWELCPGLTCQDLSRKRGSFLLKQKSNWKRITLLAYCFYGCDSEYWPVIIDHSEVAGTSSDQYRQTRLYPGLLQTPQFDCKSSVRQDSSDSASPLATSVLG